MRNAWILTIGVLVLPECNCDETLTMIEPAPASERDAEPRIVLDSGVAQADAAEADAAEQPDAAEPDAAEPDAEEPVGHPCDRLQHQSLQRSFAFADVGPCPWGQDDNLPLDGARGWSARTEQIETISDVPANAVICGATFAIPQTEMYFDDAMVIAMSGVILMTDVNIAVFENDGRFHFYDWERLKGTGGSNLYCLETCNLPPMETPGPMSLEISTELARAIGEYAAAQGNYEVRVVTIGDNDANDCRHQPFDFILTLDFVVP
jgi:hypothetical protein